MIFLPVKTNSFSTTIIITITWVVVAGTFVTLTTPLALLCLRPTTCTNMWGPVLGACSTTRASTQHQPLPWDSNRPLEALMGHIPLQSGTKSEEEHWPTSRCVAGLTAVLRTSSRRSL